MSDEHDIIPPAPERHNVTLRPAGSGDSPDLLQQIVESVKNDVAELVPIAGKALGKYVGAKGEEAVARVQEIRARIYENIGKLEIERQRLVKERDETRQKYELEAQRDKNTHDEKLQAVQSQGLRDVVDCIAKLKEQGIQVDMTVIKEVEKTMRRRLKGK
jgi:hypothetical protein